MEEGAPKLTLKGRLVATVVGLLLLVLIAEGVLRVGMPHWREFYSGWFMRAISVPNHGIVTTGLPGFDGYFAQNNGDFRIKIKINSFGLRNPEPVSQAKDRTWIIGDSMAFGWGVEQKEMYSSVIGEIYSPTYNVASPGTDVCGYQALTARMITEFTPRAVVVGLILENDISGANCQAKAKAQMSIKVQPEKDEKMVLNWLAVKRQLTEISALYNFMAVSIKRISLVRDILTSLGIIRAVEIDKRQFKSTKLTAYVKNTVSELVYLKAMFPKGTPFAVLVAPTRFELKTAANYYKNLRLSISQELRKNSISIIDPFLQFQKAGYSKIHFAHDGHWTALGHKLAAEEAAKWLKQNLSENPR
jgi:hypothetical protein